MLCIFISLFKTVFFLDNRSVFFVPVVRRAFYVVALYVLEARGGDPLADVRNTHLPVPTVPLAFSYIVTNR